MNDGRQQRCVWTDAVQAYFLDGDLEAGDLEAGGVGGGAAELDAHLRDCVECARSLSRARRLDALVAKTAADEPGRELVGRWFSEVATASTVMDPAEPSDARLPGSGLLLRAAAAAVIGLGAWWIAGRGDGTAAGVGVAVSEAGLPLADAPQAVARANAVERGRTELAVERSADAGPEQLEPEQLTPERPVLIELPSFRPCGLRRSVVHRVPTIDPLDPGSDFDRVAFATALGRAMSLGFAAGSIEEIREDGRRAAAVVRLRALNQVLVRRGAAPMDTIAKAFAAWPTDELGSMIESLRASSSFASRVTDALRHNSEERFIRLATAVGGPRIDARLRELARGDRARCEIIADALVPVHERPGRAALLLRLWSSLYSRGLIGSDLDVAHRWFVWQPTNCSDELVAELAIQRNAERRRMCLLALAARADARATSSLVELADGARHEDAVLAGFALSCMEAGADRLHELRLDRDYLRHCALLSRGDPDARRRVATGFELTSHERSWLLAGEFDEAEFRAAVALFRGTDPEAFVFSAGDE